jgi:P27 family predicted phage terminase small subunit
MGARGPLPKPNAIRRNKREVTGTATVGKPTMPATLSAEAKAEWRRVVPELERMGTITKLDRGLLIRYCTAWADWLELDGQVTKTGRLVKGKDGHWVRNPLWLLRRDAESTVTDLGRQLGLTPDARVRAGVKHEQPAAATVITDPQVADFEDERRRRLLSAG